MSELHGLSYTPEYRAWQQMRLRCTDPKHAAFPSYGGRGITVCERWLNDVRAFVDDMGPKPSPAHELDRIDNDRGYEPSNCRWATRSANNRNRRSNRWVTFRGERRLLIELCEERGVRFDTVRYRISTGWTVELAITTPTRPRRPNGTVPPHVPRATKSGIPGISWHGSKGMWRTRATVAGERLCFGEFRTIEEAAEAHRIGVAEALVRANCCEQLAEVAS